MLKRATNDPEKYIVDIPNDGIENLETAIEKIKTEYNRRKQTALKFKKFLKSTDEKIRHEDRRWKEEWKKYDGSTSEMHCWD